LKGSASLLLRLGDANTAETVRSALLPEILGFQSPRSEVSLELICESLLLEIRTDDVSSLRAVLNSYLRLIQCAEETIRIFSERMPQVETDATNNQQLR
jgi:tRNA threonylcarbamoyladenosine modification (KEOPS) complex  Pcc1 subunit